MSKPQIDTITADAYRQLTAQDVVERLKRRKRVEHHVADAVPRPSSNVTQPHKDVDLTTIPEHLF